MNKVDIFVKMTVYATFQKLHAHEISPARVKISVLYRTANALVNAF
jgi:hypothetical protein